MKSIYAMKCSLVRESEIQYKVRTENDMYDVLNAIGLADDADESLYMLCLDAKLNVIGIHHVAHGGINSSNVTPREIYKRALLNNAHGIALAHNHPSGDTAPSSEDRAFTRCMVEAGELLGIKVIEHMIVGYNSYYSMSEHGDM